MKLPKILLSIAALLLVMAPRLAAPASHPDARTAAWLEIAWLPWEREPGRYALPGSHSSVELPEGYALLRGEHARRFVHLFSRTGLEAIEAVIFDPQTFEVVTFAYFPTGYVDDAAWRDLDADALLATLQAARAAAVPDGDAIRPVSTRVTGWDEPPRYSAAYKFGSWTLRLQDEGGEERIATTVVKLSRRGFHRVTWLGRRADHDRSVALLQAIFVGHRDDDGYRHADYREGDRRVDRDIVTLMAATD